MTWDYPDFVDALLAPSFGVVVANEIETGRQDLQGGVSGESSVPSSRPKRRRGDAKRSNRFGAKSWGSSRIGPRSDFQSGRGGCGRPISRQLLGSSEREGDILLHAYSSEVPSGPGMPPGERQRDVRSSASLAGLGVPCVNNRGQEACRNSGSPHAFRQAYSHEYPVSAVGSVLDQSSRESTWATTCN